MKTIGKIMLTEHSSPRTVRTPQEANNMSKTVFTRHGDAYFPGTERKEDRFDKLPPGNYIIQQTPQGQLFFQLVDSFQSPEKIYGNCLSRRDRIMNTFHSRPKSTGLMLTGEKGSGKTLLACEMSLLAATQDIPTIIINAPWHGDAFNKLIQDIAQPALILFDEFEKVYDSNQQEGILTLLDGVFPSKKLFIITCNDEWRVDNHMRNRPGRIFYFLKYKGLELEFIREYCNDKLNNKAHIEGVCMVSTMFSKFNFDILKALVEEMNRYNETPEQALEMLNAKPLSDDVRYTISIQRKDGTTVDSSMLQPQFWTEGTPAAAETISLRYRLRKKEQSKERCNLEKKHAQAAGIEYDEYDYGSEWGFLTLTQDDTTGIDVENARFSYRAKTGETIVFTREKSREFEWSRYRGHSSGFE